MLRNALAPILALILAPAGFAAADEFKPLFNGKDLTGWVTPDDKTIWSVEDGEIVGKTQKGQLKKNEFLVTDKPYGDFVLKAKVKYKDGNSGIQVRSKRADNGKVAGPQVDIANNYWGALYDEGGTRNVMEQYPKEKAAKIVKEGDWNEFEITARGDHLTVAINGTKVIDRVDPKFDKSGIIALQVHAGPPMEVRFKDIEIKALEPSQSQAKPTAP